MAQTLEKIDSLIMDAVFGDEAVKAKSRQEIRALAARQKIYPMSMQGLYEAAGKGLYKNMTVPAMNLRGMTYDAARAVFRVALAGEVGTFVFEIARSEMGYTLQKPDEYAVCVLAAAIKEGYKGPVFIQGDHFQISRSKYFAEPQKELTAVETLVKEAIAAGFYNIDIDASTIVDISKPTLEEQMIANSQVTADMTRLIRSLQPKDIDISVGGEIGEIGKTNSTIADLRAFMKEYKKRLGDNIKGISKISVQTGTTHGGVVLPDGSIAKVQLDFKTLEELSTAAREEFGLGGAVQHGASTLPDEAFDMFPKVGALEVHLATGFQNIIFDSTAFPADLRQRVLAGLKEKYAAERKSGETDEQFYYKTRKKAFGDFKKEIWSLPEDRKQEIGEELEARFTLMFKKLNVIKTVGLVKKYVGGG